MNLLQALQAGDMAAIRAAIEADPAGAKIPRMMNVAASRANLPAVKLLHKHGGDLNGVWRNYRPLHNLMQTEPDAAGKPTAERLACLEWMLAHGADPELTGAWPSARALIIAAFLGEPAYVKALRAGGARVDGFTGAALGDAKVVAKALSANPAFANERDQGVMTALQCAAGSRLPKVDVVRVAAMLLDAGADPNLQTRSYSSTVDAAYFASAANNAEMFELLLERGADATVAVWHAVWRARYPLAERALAHGAQLDNAKTRGKPLLNDLIRWGHIPQTLWMLEHGASPNVPDSDGWTAAHQAISRGNTKMLRAVLHAGADMDCRDRAGRTPLDAVPPEKLLRMAAILAGSAPPGPFRRPRGPRSGRSDIDSSP
jgi:ankyrin repeat protein